MKPFVQSSTSYSSSSSSSSSSSELVALQQAAYLEEQSARHDSTLSKDGASLPLTPERVGHYADPLPPLKERDVVSLAYLFQRHDMYDIEADFNQMLLRLLPAPCWEEDPFEFLQEFL